MPSLILLHGALGSAETLAPLADSLAPSFDLFIPNFSGHGGKAFPPEPYSIEIFSKDVLDFMDEEGLEKAHFFGYSMGGYVALYLARHHPERIENVATLATKFDWREETARKEAAYLDPEKIMEKVPRFAEMLERRHAPLDWRAVLQHTAEMMLSLGRKPALSTEDLCAIPHPVMLAAGDQDRTATPEETLHTFRLLQNGQVWILPSTPHPLEKVNIQVLTEGLGRFLL